MIDERVNMPTVQPHTLFGGETESERTQREKYHELHKKTCPQLRQERWV